MICEIKCVRVDGMGYASRLCQTAHLPTPLHILVRCSSSTIWLAQIRHTYVTHYGYENRYPTIALQAFTLALPYLHTTFTLPSHYVYPTFSLRLTYLHTTFTLPLR